MHISHRVSHTRSVREATDQTICCTGKSLSLPRAPSHVVPQPAKKPTFRISVYFYWSSICKRGKCQNKGSAKDKNGEAMMIHRKTGTSRSRRSSWLQCWPIHGTHYQKQKTPWSTAKENFSSAMVTNQTAAICHTALTPGRQWRQNSNSSPRP